MPQDKKENQGQVESLAFEFHTKYENLIKKHTDNALSGMTDSYSTRFASGPSGYNDFIQIALSKLPQDKRDKVKDLDDLLHLQSTKFTQDAWREIYEQTESLDKKTKQTMTDPMLEGTGQPGELADTPDFPAGVQDPALQGTGQPGELYGSPENPSELILKDVKKEVSKETAKRFVLWDVLDDLGLEFNSFEKETK